jgi:hypothetical protein
MQFTNSELKKNIKSVLGPIFCFIAKFCSPRGNVEHIFEMYFGKPNKEWGVLGEALSWKVKKSSNHNKDELYLRLSFYGANKSYIEVIATILSKKEYEGGNAEARYYETGLGGILPNSKKYIVSSLDDAIDCYIDVFREYVRY